MKKLYIFILLSLTISLQGVAQNTGKLVTLKQQKTLEKLSNIYQLKASENRKKAYQIAEKYNLDTLTISKDGTVRLLQGIDDLGRPKYLKTFNNTTSAATTRTNSLYQNGSLGVNINGSSDFMTGKLAIWDGGQLLGNHQELNGRIVNVDAATTPSSHATHVAGTMVANGTNVNARGMAWGIKSLLAYDFDNDLSEMITAAPNLLVSNHSYGNTAGWYLNNTVSPARWEWEGIIGQPEDYKFGYYSSDTRKWDEICYNAPYYLPVQAAGNSRTDNGPVVGEPYWGYQNGAMEPTLIGNRPAGLSSNDSFDILTTTATAKNSLTVGAIRGVLTSINQPSDIEMSSFSSWGPTDDGRIKPDLVGAGVSVFSCSNTSTTAYRTSSGTSMATPNVSGSLILLQEYYAQLNAGNFMQSATLRGLAIHTTDEAGTTPGPDYSYGWGLLNTEKAANVIKNNGINAVIIEGTLAQGAQFSQSFVASGLEAVKATICWLDPPGAITTEGVLNSRTPKLVNDLDLIIKKGNITYQPWKLDADNPANAATQGNNTVDNIEQVPTNENIEGENYTLIVSHKGQLFSGSQNYALIITGIKIQPLPIQLTNFTAQKQNNGCLLKWETLSEKNVDRFEIQRSNNGIDFKTIATKASAGNSNFIINYNYLDNSPVIGLNYYKIITFDKDASQQTSNVVIVDFDLANNNLITVFPNPVKEVLNVNWNANINTAVRILVYDISGRKIEEINNLKGKNAKIDVSNLPIGIYLLEIQNNATGKSLGLTKFIKE
ncbi:MAG: T9SS C-terminal target domain-containing protein [Sphingobacteriales bacterium]|nr:MAG: T9SS C-terminal target domain-containing protein [Sphingobacteriales bacterium]